MEGICRLKGLLPVPSRPETVGQTLIRRVAAGLGEMLILEVGIRNPTTEGVKKDGALFCEKKNKKLLADGHDYF